MRGDRAERFERLVAEVGEPLRRYALRRLGPDAADDALAEAFVVLWRRLDDVPEQARLPWCYGVIRHCVANETRAARRRARLLLRLAGQRQPAAPAADTASWSADPALAAAVARLRPAERELLRLWAWEGLAPAEIAVVLGLTPNAVSVRLHRARRRLAEQLAPGRKDDAPPGQRPVEGGRTP